MAERKRRVPAYRLHKSSGQARVIIGRRHHYLGKYGTPESLEKYHRLVTEYLKAPGNPPHTILASTRTLGISINELILAYWDSAKKHYVKNGKPSDRQYHLRAALRPLRKLYGNTLAQDFGPKKLKLVREEMIAEGLIRKGGLNRNYINDHIGIIKRMFRWAVAEEHVPVTVHQALETVESIHKGRDPRVKESEKVLPAPKGDIQAVLKVVSPQIQAMIELQQLTGMRPDEVTIIRPCDIDRRNSVWIYAPESHKTEHLGIEKTILLGPKSQKILEPWLDREPMAYLFDPREVAEAALARRRRDGKPSIKAANRRRSRQLRRHYDDESYCQAVKRACKKAGVPKWTPGQLRHNAGTKIRHKYGLEAARIILGHSSAATSEIYAEIDREKAKEIMSEIG